MKKIFMTAMLALAAIAGLTSCSKAKKQTELKIAMVTDSGDITDQSFNQTTYEACRDFCKNNNITFQYYKPATNNTDGRVASIDAAYNDGYNVIVLPGFLFAEAIVARAETYPDAKFIALDVSADDIASAKAGYKLPSNVFCAVYDEQIPGYMAGYAAVKEGYTHLGFLGGMAVPAVIKFGYGYVQGIDAAAKEMGIADKVTCEYVYGNQFYADQAITAVMDTWYQQRNVQVVFACGGGIYQSACEAATKVPNGKVIGVDTDQKEQINKYGNDMCVTSAMKGLGATVKANLQSIVDGNWDSEYAGKISRLGLVSPVNPEMNFVQLPTDTWSMKNFKIADYEKLVAGIYNGSLKVSDDITKEPKTTIKFNSYGNIK